MFMKAYQVTEFGKPLELIEYENPKPQGNEVLIKIVETPKLPYFTKFNLL